MNEEFPVSASHKLALITSLPFVHTAASLLSIERFSEGLGLVSVWRASAGTVGREDARTRSLGESKSRNKVSVGEPAEGSLKVSVAIDDNESSKTNNQHKKQQHVCMAGRGVEAHEAPHWLVRPLLCRGTYLSSMRSTVAA
ncbi:hypothetical protein Bpfe_030856 [Biomphalaria pfeifferi]|uniref:Uncharacterized protein n=1 Tax=Biomphalaria pfeifferi TaxID=112525 RepID=A0AAD8ETU8_BIOPF|nr:hypothetical protein Bpfe_030856 [Biomphalaria pfeifferi]